jgi:hypothetical protein
MCTADKINVMFLSESRNNLLTKSERDTTIILTPSLDVLVGIRPEKITQKTSVWNVGGSHYTLNLLKRAKLWAQATMHAKNLLIDESCNGEAIEAVSESLPKLDVIAALALIIESINTINGGALMVSTEEEEVLGVLNLIGQEEAHCLEGLLATVDIVTKEQIFILC